jgi:hypothetical protein
MGVVRCAVPTPSSPWRSAPQHHSVASVRVPQVWTPPAEALVQAVPGALGGAAWSAGLRRRLRARPMHRGRGAQPGLRPLRRGHLRGPPGLLRADVHVGGPARERPVRSRGGERLCKLQADLGRVLPPSAVEGRRVRRAADASGERLTRRRSSLRSPAERTLSEPPECRARAAPRFAALTPEALDAAREAAIADVERASLAWPETCTGHGSRSRGGYASGTCMRDVVPRAAPHDVT